MVMVLYPFHFIVMFVTCNCVGVSTSMLDEIAYLMCINPTLSCHSIQTKLEYTAA